MVLIPTKLRDVGLQTPNYPTVQIDDSIGRGLQAVGGALADLASHAMARQKQKDGFNAQIGYDALQEQLQQDMTEAERNSAADGSGLHDGFMAKNFKPRTDAFLASITDKDLRDKFEARIVQLDSERWGNAAANREYAIGNKHSMDSIGTMWQGRARGIAQDPAQVTQYVADMERIIADAPNLTSAQRDQLRQKVRESAPTVAAEALRQTDPETLYFATGNGTHDERMAFLMRRLVPAVRMAENAASDPRAVSKDGAIGLMQVTLGAADTVAREMGDKAFLDLDQAQRAEFLKIPTNNLRYGTAYLQMMVARYHGDVEAALVAYNAGPGNADKWLDRGRDYGALPRRAETEPYVAKVMGGMGAAKLASGAGGGDSGARIGLVTGTQAGRQPLNMDGVNPVLLANFERVQGAFGKALPIVSGFRDPATNAAAGGAKHSQHMAGTAIDLDVSGLSKTERVRLIELASAQGFTGIGIYRNSIHLDMRKGAPVAWGPTHHADSVPAWAFVAAAKHRAGKAGEGLPDAPQGIAGSAGNGAATTAVSTGDSRSGFISTAFADMPAADLQRWQSNASDLRLKTDSAAKMQVAQDKQDASALIATDVASISQAGKSVLAPAEFEAKSAEVYRAAGPEDHAKWIEDRTVAQRVYDLAHDAASLPQDQMAELLQSITPKGGMDAASQQRVYDGVQKKFDEVAKLRAADPGLAVLQMAPLRDAAQAVDWSKPDSVKDFLSQVDAAQTMLGIDKQLLPKAQAEQLGAQIRNVMAANPGFEEEATRSLLHKLQQTYGDYADDVFTQAFETILEKDLSKDTRDIMSNTMLGWLQANPGLRDQRLMLQNNAAAAGELGASDKQPALSDNPQPSRSWWGFLTGEAPPEPQPPAQKPIPTGPAVKPQPITIDGVPPEAIDVFMRNAGNMRIQAMFRDVYGGDRLTQMQKLLREQGMAMGRQ